MSDTKNAPSSERPVRSTGEAGEPQRKQVGRGLAVGRRSFLQQAGSAALGLGSLGLAGASFAKSADAAAAEGGAPAAAPSSDRIQRYKSLGDTGLRIPDIGAGGLGSPEIVRYCYDKGITYFDCSQKFMTEGNVGRGLAGVRHKVVVTTKSMIGARENRRQMMRRLNGSLRQLRTDYVDIYLNHAVNEIERVKNPEWPEFVELAKKMGKIRFSGMSGHGGNLQDCLNYVIDNDRADVILSSHNFGTDPAFYERFTKHFDFIANQKGIASVFEKAHAKGVGVIVMKTLMGAKVNDLARYQKNGASFPQAAFRWVLSNPNVDALIISMKSKELVDQYVRCSGDATFAQSDADVLRQYVDAETADHCRTGCSSCETSCPYGVPIADVLRHRMYAESYDDMEMARRGYRELGAAASPCASCSEPPCLNACEYGLVIPALTRATDTLLRRG